MARDDVRRVYWDITCDNDAPDDATYSAMMGDERYWCSDLTIGQVKTIMTQYGYHLELCGTGAPYFLIFRDANPEKERQSGFFHKLVERMI